jgi:hypothetical protein
MFSRVARVKRSSWILLGIVLGAVIAPGAALAAFTDVRVVGVFGSPPAHVTPAYQLRVAEMDPANIRTYRLSADSSSCATVDVPAGNSFLIRQAQVDVFLNGAPGALGTVYIYASKSCAGVPIAEVTPLSTRQTEQIPFGPGVPVPAGGGFSTVAGSGALSAAVHFTGYLMPPAAVPAGTPGPQARGISKEAALR